MVQQCLDILENGVTAQDKDGNVVKLTPSASMLAVVVKFLKDNGIDDFDDTDAEPNRELIETVKNIPDFDKSLRN
jgi:hypothetical protein